MQTGDVFAGRYRVVHILSRGPMGTVCEADHLLTRQRVVLKLIRDNISPRTHDQDSWRTRFRREVRAAAGLNSEHVAKVLDAATDPETGISYIVMECLVGEDVGEALRRLGCFPVGLALRIVSQACRGVRTAHDAGVVHRDIKPANLFLAEAEDGSVVVKLLDFGLAKALTDGAGLLSHRDVTNAGGVLGTPSYMSPEQAREPRDIDGRTDVWSLGAVLHRMLSGQPPRFGTGCGPADMLIALATGESEPTPIQTLAPWVPPEVAAIVHRALRRDPEQRYASVRQMHEDILVLLDSCDALTSEGVVALREEERQVPGRPMTDEDVRDRPSVSMFRRDAFPIGCRPRFRATTVAVFGLLAATWLFAKEAGVPVHFDPPPRSTAQPLRVRALSAPSATDSAEPRDGLGRNPQSRARSPIPRPETYPRWTPPITDPGF